MAYLFFFDQNFIMHFEILEVYCTFSNLVLLLYTVKNKRKSKEKKKILKGTCLVQRANSRFSSTM